MERFLTLEQREALSMLNHLTGISFVVIGEEEGSAGFPEILETYYDLDFWRSLWKTRKNTEQETVLLELAPQCYIGLADLDHGTFLCTVPVCPDAKSASRLLAALSKGFSSDHPREFFHYLLSMSGRPNYHLAELCALARKVCGDSLRGRISIDRMPSDQKETEKKEEEIRTEDGPVFPQGKEASTIPAGYRKNAGETALAQEKSIHERDIIMREHSRMSSVYHQSIESMKVMMQTIADGDVPTLEIILSHPNQGGLGVMSFDPLQQARYGFVCMVTAACIYAVRGGLSEQRAFDERDYFCQQMEKMQDVDSIYEYHLHCMKAYCEKVAQIRHVKRISSYTRQAQAFIEQHLYEDLDVPKVCRNVSLNRKSLGEYMKRDTGRSIAAYILDRRLQESAYLLHNSDLSLGDISTLLHFSSQSHFTRCFRDKYHCTPMQYRLHENFTVAD